MKKRSAILVVEDAEDDALLIRRTLLKGRCAEPSPFRAEWRRGYFLFARGRALLRPEKFPLPALVLLDLKLPGMVGSRYCSGFDPIPIRTTCGLSS